MRRFFFLLILPFFAFSQQTVNDSIMHNNVHRTYITYIPALYNSNNPTPLVFNLHGRTIVRSPKDAVVDFIDCNIDELFIEGYCVKRKYNYES